MTFALVGSPNVGKSTLFNALTGLNQRVGNFPGVTVEPLVGGVDYAGKKATIIDLPGIYGLQPTSEDEQLTVDVLNGTHQTIPRPDALVLVVNATSPEKSFALHSQLAMLGLPMMIAVTMVDAVKAAGGVFDDVQLMHRLGIPVFPVVGSKGLGIADIKAAIVDSNVRVPIAPLEEGASMNTRASWSAALTNEVVKAGREDTLSVRLDSILLHPVFGGIAFVVVMALFFQSIFTWATPLMDLVEAGITALQDGVAANVDNSILQSFLVKGLIGGVGSVLVFLPQILILNILVTLLEECGYLARAAFLVDRVMGLFGLQGRSFIPLLGSFACAIPGIMSARIIPSYRDRMATIMATPLMTCSARLPVYTLLIGAMIPATSLVAGFSLQALIMAGLYAAGALSGLLIALLLKRTLFRGSVIPFLMEFPPYRVPSLRSIGVTTVNRSKDFLRTAGTVILAFSIGLWVLTELPRATTPPNTSEVDAQRIQIEQSYAAHLGRTIQPVFAPLGFDWRITLGVISSYAARETFVASMGQIYAADVTESDSTLRTVLQQRVPFHTGLAVLVFYVFALQCISTMAIMKRETSSWKWPAASFAITFVMAYVSSWIVATLFAP